MSKHTEFSFSTISDFDAHIAGEIRGYEILDDIIQGLADMLMEDGTNVYDLGCSTGRLLNQLATSIQMETDEARKRNINFVGIEPNLNFAKDHADLPGNVRVLRSKISGKTVYDNASVILSIFTLQFIPVPERAKIIKQIYDGLTMSGAFIWAEKVYASDPQLESIINRRHIDFKQRSSSPEDILGKDQRLRAIMHPLPMRLNLEMLDAAGFTRHEVIWRVNNFVGLIALK